VQYGRNYASLEEYEYRFSVFIENMKLAAEHQAKNPMAEFGVTQFSDLTTEEFRSQYLTADPSFINITGVPETKTNFSGPSWPGVAAPNPTNYDWEAAGCLTAVKNQGQCGSCWAFSATETIESYWALGGHGLATLSPEQIVDCDTTCYGCNGGWPYLAYQYVQKNGGISSESSYPYIAGNGKAGTCHSATVTARVTGYKNIAGEAGLYSQLSSASGGPVSVCVDASAWSSYRSGVLSSCGTSVDHCVQATGYANYGQNGAYWRVRNSWGASWGQNGYIYIAIGRNLCAIGNYATVVTV